MIDAKAYKELEAVVGPENITDVPVLCDTYAVQPFHRPTPDKWIFRPAAVVLPGSTEEVSEMVKILYKYKIKYKTHSTGFGAQSGPGEDGVVQVDLRRMNKIIEIDEKNMYAVIEPYVPQMHIQLEAWKRGLNLMLITAGPQTSNLASLTSHEGSGSSTSSMGYNGRNLLGFEWVSPTGEIIKGGPAEFDAGWFSADGPGPSMKGIIRGSRGYDGGFGIFTKATVKLYHWAGPRDMDSVIKNDGHLMDVEAEIPENIHHYNVFLPDWQELKDFYVKLAESEIAFSAYKMPLGFTALSYLNEAITKMARYPILRNLLKAGQHRIELMIVGNTPGDLEYKLACLNQIVEETGAICIGGHPKTHLDKIFAVSTLRGTDYLNLFNGPGTFHVSMGADESVDVAMEQGRYAAELKEELIAEGLTSDDIGDGTWGGIRDHTTWCHGEALLQYDPQNPKYRPTMFRFSQTCSELQHSKHLGGLGFSLYGGAGAIDLFSPDCYNFFDYVLDIKRIWDPDDLGNLTLM